MNGTRDRAKAACACYAVILIGVMALLILLPGCGNVTLKGDAMTAAQQSTMDAYQAAIRNQPGATQPASQPASGTIQSYLVENFRQWRSFVRSAKADLTWGPKLAGE